jgi:ABC-2 type transport system permease protein
MAGPVGIGSRPSGIVVAAAIAWRELVRFSRQPGRVAASVGTPCMIWILLSSGLADSFRPAGALEPRYGAFLLPGMMTLVTVFASMFCSMSIIDDRNEGWLQAVLVSPAPRWSVAVGKIAGGSILAWAQAAVLLPAAPLVGIRLTLAAAGLVTIALVLLSISIMSLGLTCAWFSKTTAGFHGVMNLLLMPLWLLSSAMFPLDGAAPWLSGLMHINPLTWCTESIRGPLLGYPFAGSLALAVCFALASAIAACAVIGRPR